MRPRLYPADTLDFASSNGVGILSDAISCRVLSGMGSEELELQYPAAGLHFSALAMRGIIAAKPDPVRAAQPYRIYKITKPMAGVVTVYARHIVYDLMGVPAKPFTASNATLALEGLKANAAVDNPFQFYTDKSTVGSFSVAAPTAIWSLLGGMAGSILDVFGGEYEFDGLAVKLLGRRGADRGVSIRYGKNLTSLEQNENCANCYTGIMPYWVDMETGAVVTLPEGVLYAPGDYGYTRILPLDLSQEFAAAPSEDALRTRAEQYMEDNRIGEPTVSWKVEFVQLEQTEEYRGQALLERVQMGDTVHVEFPAMGVSAPARAVAADYDCLRDRYNSVTLGSVRQSLSSTIVEQQKEIAKKPDVTAVQGMVDAATGSILGAKGGSVRLLDTDGDGMPDTLYIADHPDPAQAVKVWRYNYEGWGASENGYNGPFSVAATLEDGMVADFITTGTLVANLINAGTLQSSNGTFRFNLDTGEIYIGGYATEQSVDNLQSNLDGQMESLTNLQSAFAKLLLQSDQIALQVQNIVQNGVDKVLTTTGYVFGADGLNIHKAGDEIETRIDNTGLYVSRGEDMMLQANHLGVVARDLTANHYLIFGAHARFEDYSGNRTACFYIGKESEG